MVRRIESEMAHEISLVLIDITAVIIFYYLKMATDFFRNHLEQLNGSDSRNRSANRLT